MPTYEQVTRRHLEILLVEDSEDDAALLELYLKRSGYAPVITRVETAAEMSQALADPAHPWDVILADYNLPSFSAPQALRLLKSTTLDLPFIVMSGAVTEETAVASMRAGAHDYVSKQNLARLIPAIEREIGEAKDRRDRLAAERALRLSEERFRQLVEAMPLGLLLSDRAGRILYGNAALLKLLGYSKQEIESGTITFAQLFAPKTGHSGASHDAWEGHGEPVETSLITREGAVVPTLMGTALLNPQSPPYEQQIAAFLADLTDQKRGQDVLRRTEKLAAAGRMAASIAHEINNPLEAVTNCLYLIAQTDLTEDGQKYVNLAQTELERVIHITTQTLRFYRQNSQPVKTDVHDLIETVLALWDKKLHSYGIRIDRRLEQIPRIVAYDGEVRQVIANLICNAMDAMQNSGGKLVVHTAPATDWKQLTPGIAITIADTGSGMDRKTLERIFEPFFSTKGLTGTGLGLWVSHELIEKHYGSISVRSWAAQPSGTVFRLFLPLEPPAAYSLDTL
ncbi:MAG TPA: ATP-binding protein [Acidisarcina sp.]|nr:ATP-binding protein [Acidisarcina sp.]